MVSCYSKAAAFFAAAFLSLAGVADILRWQVTGQQGTKYRYAWTVRQTAAEAAIAQACPAWSWLGMPNTPANIFRRELLDFAGSPTASLRDVLATGCVTLKTLPVIEMDAAH